MNSFRLPLALLSTLALTLPMGCEMNSDRQGTNSDQQRNAESSTRAYESSDQVADSITIPAGTQLIATLDQDISTDSNKSGDTFRATVSSPLVVNGRTVMNSGSSVRGVLREVRDSGDVVGRAHMTLDFETLVSSTGSSHEISARPLTVQAGTEGASVIAKGDELGSKAGSASNSYDNDGVHSMGDKMTDGSVLVYATHGENVRLESGQRVVVHFTGPMRVMSLSRN